MTREKCPTCASYVEVVSGDDGTSYFVPIDEANMKAYPKDMSQAKRIIVQLEGRIKELEEKLAIK